MEYMKGRNWEFGGVGRRLGYSGGHHKKGDRGAGGRTYFLLLVVVRGKGVARKER